MRGSLSFDIDGSHFARQLDIAADRPALAALAARCTDYFRLTFPKHLDPHDAPRLFPAMLRLTRAPDERSMVLGIYAGPAPGPARPPRLAGVLCFLYPHPGEGSWFITLLLMEPSARGKGLGAAVHRAFERWAVGRGARRLVVSVADHNPRARRFWRDRLGYREKAPSAAASDGEPDHQELERWITDPGCAAPAWSGPGHASAGG